MNSTHANQERLLAEWPVIGRRVTAFAAIRLQGMIRASEASGHTPNDMTVEDLRQSMWVFALENIESWQPETKTAYLYLCNCINEVASRARRKSRRRGRRAPMSSLEALNERCPEGIYPLSTNDIDPETALIEKDFINFLHRTGDRRLLKYHIMRKTGYETSEIASMLSCTLTQVYELARKLKRLSIEYISGKKAGL
jgi:DNA-directed RNA polymerase specialized sigma24 family protein